MIQQKDKNTMLLHTCASLSEQGSSEQEEEKNGTLKGEHLYALVLKLRAKAPGVLQSTAGELAQAALLHWFAAVDKTLATQLHIPNQRRPFTCSGLWQNRHHAKGEHSVWSRRPLPIRTEGIYWLRVTLLSERLFHPFMTRYLQATSLPEGQTTLGLPQFQCGQICFDVVEMLSTPHSIVVGNGSASTSTWSGHTTYQELIHAALAVQSASFAARTIGFEFCSPTAFSDGQRGWKHHMYRLPSPDRVFGNLAKSWNMWAPPAFHIDQKRLQVYCQQWVDLSDYELHTDTLLLTHAPQKGFLGWCIYFVMEQEAGSLKEETCPIMPGMPELCPAQILHLLHRFSFYAGIGTKTAMGMGQVRMLTGVSRPKVRTPRRSRSSD
jgi:CRISPR-associated endoribonuclease Cas6